MPWAVPATIDPMVQAAAKVLAVSALRLLEDDKARDAAKAEFDCRKAEKNIPPLCDYPAPVDFAWPEYVETARGRDWCIPTGAPK